MKKKKSFIEKGADIGVKILDFTFVKTTKFGYRAGRGLRSKFKK
jgi:hypothetical protein